MNTRSSFLILFLSVALIVSGLLLVPFVSNYFPFSRKEPTAILIASIQSGTYKTIVWEQKPVAIFRPTEAIIKELVVLTPKTLNHRDIPAHPEVFVYYLISSHRGCRLTHAPRGASPKAIGMAEKLKWTGGFFDPCHYGEWDYAGRAISVYDIYSSLPDLKTPKYSVENGSVFLLE